MAALPPYPPPTKQGRAGNPKENQARRSQMSNVCSGLRESRKFLGQLQPQTVPAPAKDSPTAVVSGNSALKFAPHKVMPVSSTKLMPHSVPSLVPLLEGSHPLGPDLGFKSGPQRALGPDVGFKFGPQVGRLLGRIWVYKFSTQRALRPDGLQFWPVRGFWAGFGFQVWPTKTRALGPDLCFKFAPQRALGPDVGFTFGPRRGGLFGRKFLKFWPTRGSWARSSLAHAALGPDLSFKFGPQGSGLPGPHLGFKFGPHGKRESGHQSKTRVGLGCLNFNPFLLRRLSAFFARRRPSAFLLLFGFGASFKSMCVVGFANMASVPAQAQGANEPPQCSQC